MINVPPNNSLKQTPRLGQNANGGALRRCLAQSRSAESDNQYY
jgi:hypothetical protein